MCSPGLDRKSPGRSIAIPVNWENADTGTARSDGVRGSAMGARFEPGRRTPSRRLRCAPSRRAVGAERRSGCRRRSGVTRGAGVGIGRALRGAESPNTAGTLGDVTRSLSHSAATNKTAGQAVFSGTVSEFVALCRTLSHTENHRLTWENMEFVADFWGVSASNQCSAITRERDGDAALRVQIAARETVCAGHSLFHSLQDVHKK